MRDLSIAELLENARYVNEQVGVAIFQVCGIVGAGKTTVVKRLQEAHKRFFPNTVMKFVYEDVEDPECVSAIREYYNKDSVEEPSSGKLEQTIVMAHIRNLLRSIPLACSEDYSKAYNFDTPIIIVTDRSITEDLLFIKTLMQGKISKGDKAALQILEEMIDIIENMLNTFTRKNRHVFLDVPEEVCLEHIKKRNRDYECALTLKDMKKFKPPKQYITDTIPAGSLSPEACAVMLAMIIRKHFQGFFDAPPIHKMMVGLYGLPGVGKTTVLKALQARLKKLGRPYGAWSFWYDKSDTETRKKHMGEAYENETMSNSAIQEYLDKDRLDDRGKAERDAGYWNEYLFTDIGAETSAIFKFANGNIRAVSEGDDNYRNTIRKDFKWEKEIFVMLHSPIEEIEARVKDRARPGEAEGLNRDYTEKLSEAFRDFRSETCKRRGRRGIVEIVDILYKPTEECIENCINEILSAIYRRKR